MPARTASPKQARQAASQGNPTQQQEDELEEVVQLMEARDFGEAAKRLNAMLKRNPKDTLLMHNLGVVYTEQGLFAEAEEIFLRAYETQKKDGKVNYATMYGLATVLTEQGDMPKLLQAEALFHEYLEKAIAQEENGIVETFRALDGLAQNLEKQKRWMEAAEARRSALQLGSRMFGEESERTAKLKLALARADRLARWQWYIRAVLWSATVAAPVLMAIMWRRQGGPLPWDFIWNGWVGVNSAGAEAAAAEAAQQAAHE